MSETETAPPSLYVATPCYGGMAHAAFARGLLALQEAFMHRGWRLQINLGGGEALISRARAGMLAHFLTSEASHLLFIDADIGFEPAQVFRLLDSQLHLVGGVYARKRVDPLGAAEPTELELETLPGENTGPDGFQRVASVGAGFLLVARQTARAMTEAYPQLRAKLGDVQGVQTPEASMLFEPMIDPDSRRYLAEHQAFCRRWRQLGGDVWADRQSMLLHIGEAQLTTGVRDLV